MEEETEEGKAYTVRFLACWVLSVSTPPWGRREVAMVISGRSTCSHCLPAHSCPLCKGRRTTGALMMNQADELIHLIHLSRHSSSLLADIC